MLETASEMRFKLGEIMKHNFTTPKRRPKKNAHSPYSFSVTDNQSLDERSTIQPQSASYIEEARVCRKMAMDCARATLNTAKQLRAEIKEKNLEIEELKCVILDLDDYVNELRRENELLKDTHNNMLKNNRLVCRTICTQTTYKGLRNQLRFGTSCQSNTNVPAKTSSVTRSSQTSIQSLHMSDNDSSNYDKVTCDKEIMVCISPQKVKNDPNIKWVHRSTQHTVRYANAQVNTQGDMLMKGKLESCPVGTQTVDVNVIDTEVQTMNDFFPLEEYDDNEFEDEFTSHNAHLSIEGTIPTHESNDEIEQNEGGEIHAMQHMPISPMKHRDRSLPSQDKLKNQSRMPTNATYKLKSFVTPMIKKKKEQEEKIRMEKLLMRQSNASYWQMI